MKSLAAARGVRPAVRVWSRRASGLGPGKLAWPTYVLLGLLVVIAALLRFPDLGVRSMWVDEAESSINAITILQHGVPVDNYLGVPIYENTLVEPWPDHPEYAYRDSSYSRKGLAIYHGWLPLYLIAGGLKAAGIEPDLAPRIESDADLHRRLVVRDDKDDRERRNWAARLPMAILGVLMVPLAWAVAREMGGTTAAWAAALLITANATMIEFSRQARYYIPTIFVSLFCVWLLFRLWTRRHHFRYRDTLGLALAVAALFHTHLTTCFTICLIGVGVVACMPWTRRNIVRLIPAALLFASLTVPWLLLVGFFETSSKLPSAWKMMDLPVDLFRYPRSKFPYVLIVLALLTWVAVAHRPLSKWAPKLLARPGRRITPSVLILSLTVALGYIVFATLIPAASFFPRRLTMSLFGPGVLLVALLLGTFADTLGRYVANKVVNDDNAPPRRAAVQLAVLGLTLGAVVLHLYWVNRLPTNTRFPEGGGSAPAAIAVLAKYPLTPLTKVYATPNDHLPLAFYSGIPVQSIAPVRKTFLDSYPHGVAIVQASSERHPMPWSVTRMVAAQRDVSLSEKESGWESVSLHQNRAFCLLDGKVARITNELRPVPIWGGYWNKVQDWHFKEATRNARRTLGGGMLMRRPFDVTGPSDWWRIFFLRFCEAQPPRVPPLIWRDRVKNATATLLEYGEVVYYSPGPVGTPPEPEPVTIHIDPLLETHRPR